MNKFDMVMIEIVMTVLIVVYSFFTWYFFGRDPKRKTITPEFNEPDNISSMLIAYVNGERDSRKIMKIGMLSLLMKGYIHLVDKNGKENRKYILNKKNRDNLKLRKETLFEEENNLLDTLSDDDLFGNELKIMEYKNRIVYFLEKKYKRIIYKNNYLFFVPIILAIAISIVFILLQVFQGNWGRAITGTIFLVIWLIYVYSISEGVLKFLYAMIIVGIIAIVIVYLDIFSGLTLSILGIIFLVYEKAIGKYTVSGLRKMEYIKGLKMYFETAEKNRMDKFETEKEKITYFNRIFPYIVALGMEKENLEIFKDSLEFLNVEGSYEEARYYVDEYVGLNFPFFRKNIF